MNQFQKATELVERINQHYLTDERKVLEIARVIYESERSSFIDGVSYGLRIQEKPEAQNYGCSVRVVFNENSSGAIMFTGERIFRNVTEIHYLYRKGMVAIESDIHGTGNTFSIIDIKEFETKLETEKAFTF